MLALQRGERAEARRRWPDTCPEPDDEYYSPTEREWRKLSRSGVPVIRLVPATAADLAAFAEASGDDATDPVVKARYAETVEPGRPGATSPAGAAPGVSTRSAAAGYWRSETVANPEVG